MKLMNITEDDITDEKFGTKTEAEVTVPLFSLYNDITPPKKEDRTAEANGNNSHSNRFAATASEQTQTQNTNGNNSQSNGFAATASEPMLGTDSNSTKVFCPKCRGIFSVDQLKLHMPTCQGTSHWSFGT